MGRRVGDALCTYLRSLRPPPHFLPTYLPTYQLTSTSHWGNSALRKASTSSAEARPKMGLSGRAMMLAVRGTSRSL